MVFPYSNPRADSRSGVVTSLEEKVETKMQSKPLIEDDFSNSRITNRVGCLIV